MSGTSDTLTFLFTDELVAWLLETLEQLQLQQT